MSDASQDGPESNPSPSGFVEQIRRAADGPGSLAERLRELTGKGVAILPLGAKQVMQLFQSQPSPRSLWNALLDGDLLQVRARACGVLLGQFRLLDPERMLRCGTARIAFRANGYRGVPDLDAWLELCIEEAIRDCLLSDSEAEQRQVPVVREEADKYALMTELLGVPEPLTRRSMLQWNRLPDWPRQLVFECVVRGRALSELATERGLPLSQLEKELKGIFDLLGKPGDHALQYPTRLELQLPWANEQSAQLEDKKRETDATHGPDEVSS